MNRGFANLFLRFFVIEAIFSGDHSLVYETLVVPRNSRIIGSGRGANGVSGFREHFHPEFPAIRLRVNKRSSRAF